MASAKEKDRPTNLSWTNWVLSLIELAIDNGYSKREERLNEPVLKLLRSLKTLTAGMFSYSVMEDRSTIGKTYKRSVTDLKPGVWNSYARLVRLGTFCRQTSRFYKGTCLRTSETQEIQFHNIQFCF